MFQFLRQDVINTVRDWVLRVFVLMRTMSTLWRLSLQIQLTWSLTCHHRNWTYNRPTNRKV